MLLSFFLDSVLNIISLNHFSGEIALGNPKLYKNIRKALPNQTNGWSSPDACPTTDNLMS